MNIELIFGIMASAITIVGGGYGLYIKFSKHMNRNREKKEKEIEKRLNFSQRIDNMDKNVKAILKRQKEQDENIEKLQENNERLEVQQLRYMINDSFLGYDSIDLVPDDLLLNAAECCKIYLDKGYNHLTGTRCKIISEEINRRVENKAKGGGKNGKTS